MGKRHIWIICATVVSVVAIAASLVSQRHLFGYLEHINLITTAELIAVLLLFHAFNGLLLRVVASKFGVVLRAKEWFGLPFVTAMGNYITPFAGGMFARGSYLKYRHFFPYAKFVSVTGASYLIYGWVSGVAGIAGVVLLVKEAAYSKELILFFVAMVLILSFCGVMPAVRVSGEHPAIAFLNSAVEGWVLIRKDPAILTRLALCTSATVLLNGIAFWLAFNALSGGPVSFGLPFVISIFFSFSIFIRVTPGNLGISEAIATLASEFLGMGAGMGFMASLLIRAASLIPIFVLGPVFSLLLTRELTGSRR